MLILMVEDDEPTALQHRRALELAGHHVVVVATGVDDARHCLDALVFDAVLSDYDLSEEENGAELLIEVRCRYPQARRILYASELPWRMKLAAQAVAHSVIDGIGASEELVSALAA